MVRNPLKVLVNWHCSIPDGKLGLLLISPYVANHYILCFTVSLR